MRCVYRSHNHRISYNHSFLDSFGYFSLVKISRKIVLYCTFPVFNIGYLCVQTLNKNFIKVHKVSWETEQRIDFSKVSKDSPEILLSIINYSRNYKLDVFIDRKNQFQRGQEIYKNNLRKMTFGIPCMLCNLRVYTCICVDKCASCCAL